MAADADLEAAGPLTSQLQAFAAYGILTSMTDARRDQNTPHVTLIVRFAAAVATTLSIVLALATAYAVLLFWGPHNYAPFWMQAIPWIVIGTAPFALAPAVRRSKAVFLICSLQVALTFYPLVIPVSFAWTSTNPWRFIP